eukprot:gnl/TRDRNA2_/TRDRNA2_174429_c0_seq1.p1 gnl/TRDRNA2_/TRDRNA2_174429_c0~~gnl/TRDRNA2_/TRDRNA2_174429_c0_seq1.p1  ORF type:complete len:208 (-),score=62.21 gnl/TRDRNA2_/TRDRNA2_174429_c0_seq1:293-916(-)
MTNPTLLLDAQVVKEGTGARCSWKALVLLSMVVGLVCVGMWSQAQDPVVTLGMQTAMKPQRAWLPMQRAYTQQPMQPVRAWRSTESAADELPAQGYEVASLRGRRDALLAAATLALAGQIAEEAMALPLEVGSPTTYLKVGRWDRPPPAKKVTCGYKDGCKIEGGKPAIEVVKAAANGEYRGNLEKMNGKPKKKGAKKEEEAEAPKA